MRKSIFSNIIEVDKNVTNIEQELETISKGKIVRWAIVDTNYKKYKINYSYIKSGCQ